MFTRIIGGATGILAFFSSMAFAADTGGGVSTNLTNPLGNNATFTSIAQNLITGLTAVAVPVVGIMVLIGGLQIITAGGKEESYKKGRQTIFYAVIGFAVVLLADAIIGIIRGFLGA